MFDEWFKKIVRKFNFSKISLVNFLYIALDMLRDSPRALYYVVALIIGLGLARLVDTSILAYVTLSQREESPLKISKKSNYTSILSSSNVDSLSIIGGPLYSPAPITEEAQEEKVIPQFDYTVLGTIDGDPSYASVVVNLLGGEIRGTHEYGIGSKIGSDIVLWIGREYITIRRGKQKLKIKVGENALTVVSQEVSNSKDRKGSVQKTISRQDASKLLKNPAAIYIGASFGPVLNKGKITGYKVFKVEPSHFFYKLGARGGDIVRKVNGFKLNDTERMFELWKSMKTASQIAIDLERNGKVLQYDLKIVN